MPSDVNGVYSLPDGYLAVTGETIQASQHNPPLEDIAASMTQRVMKSGATPMTGPLKHTSGSAAAPGVTFNNGTGTGLYLTSDGVGVSVSGNKVAEFTANGLSTGVRFIGEMFAYAGSTAPSLCVFPYGQTLSRTTYADLWTFAQVEITAGNTFFNNGNGTTTFGIGDLRGRVIAAPDNMGGSAASRLTSTYYGAAATTQGLAGGADHTSNTIAKANLPAYNLDTSGLSVTPIGRQNSIANSSGPTSVMDILQTAGGGGTTSATYPVNGAVALGGSGTALQVGNVQPTILTNIAMFAGA